MTRSLIRVATVGALGAVGGAACLVLVYASRPELTLEMDRELPRRIASGIYTPERDGDRTFVWTSRQAGFRFSGLNRDAPWTCSVVFRGGRAGPAEQPSVDIAVDGITVGGQTATNDFELIEVTAPERPRRPGLTLTVTSSATVIPGGSDGRELGVQIDRLACRPSGAGISLPPRAALNASAIGGAAIGAALGLCLPIGAAVAGAVLLAAAQAIPLASGPAPYGVFPGTAFRLALSLAGAMLVAVRMLELRHALPHAARFAVLFSAGALYLKLLGLAHPSKLLIDAVYHAHRFQSVLAGQYYFTQIMPGGVTFPYAIGLYVVAAPWSVFTRDHVLLLRIVVSAAEAIAGLLLYLVVVKAWNDRLAAALSVVLFHLVPLPYGLIGNANLTNAFGQSVSLATLAGAAIWPLRMRAVAPMAALFLLTALAFLSHISTAALLAVTLVSLAGFYRCFGESTLSRSAASILVVAILAAACSWVIYYGHFTDVYKTALQRVRPASGVSAPPPHQRPAGPGAESATPTPVPRTVTTVRERATGAFRMTAAAIGWPIVVLALAGTWQLYKHGARDRLALLLAAWGATYVVFFGVGILPQVDAPFERYAAEFVGRVVLATYPAAVVLGARGAAWGWRAGGVPRAGILACVIWAIAGGVHQWRGWFE